MARAAPHGNAVSTTAGYVSGQPRAVFVYHPVVGVDVARSVMRGDRPEGGELVDLERVREHRQSRTRPRAGERRSHDVAIFPRQVA